MKPIILMLTIFLGLLQACVAEEHQEERHALILAKPGRVQLIGEIEAPPGDFAYGARFEVRLSDIEVIRGNFPDRTAVVRMTATHPSVIRSKKKIYLLVRGERENLEVLYWGRPYLVACVPEGMVNEASFQEPFELEEEKAGRQQARACAMAGWAE